MTCSPLATHRLLSGTDASLIAAARGQFNVPVTVCGLCQPLQVRLVAGLFLQPILLQVAASRVGAMHAVTPSVAAMRVFAAMLSWQFGHLHISVHAMKPAQEDWRAATRMRGVL